jgi:hypothetical protein
MEFSSTDSYHEFTLQFTRKTGGSGRIPVDQVGRIAVHRMRDWSKRIKPQPLAVTLYQKASRAIDVLLAGRFIDSPECKPRHMRKVVMNRMIVIVQNQLRIAQSLSGWDLRLIAE